MAVCKVYSFRRDRESPFSLAECNPCRFRFLECNALLDEEIIRISEYTALPKQYATISYVWKGSDCASGKDPARTLRVSGAELANSIDTDILKCAARAATSKDCDFLWLDQLCIMQTSREDKDWQITRMYQIYHESQVCLAFLDGLGRLADIFKPWPWLTRAWTLQEALAPPAVYIIFAWTHGTQHYQVNAPITIDEIETGKSAMMELERAIYALQCYGSFPSMSKNIRDGHLSKLMRSLQIAIFYNKRSKAQFHPFRSFSILQCSFSRTSSRPVDMILSIMGSFDVHLDPSQLASTDRERALLMLIQQCLRRGEPAWWLAMSQAQAVGIHSSYLPPFPLTTTSGTPQIPLIGGRLVRATNVLGGDVTALIGAPHGHMEDDGLLTLHARQCRVRYIMSLSKEFGNIEDCLMERYLADHEESGIMRLWELPRSQYLATANLKPSGSEVIRDIVALLGVDSTYVYADDLDKTSQEFCAIHVGAVKLMSTGEFGVSWHNPEPHVFFLLQRAQSGSRSYWTKVGVGRVKSEELERWAYDDISLR
ncbi:hypothetical protein Q7P35_008953 [Cladosporium inversicolor]